MMSVSSEVSIFFSMLLSQAPVILVCVVCFLVLLTRTNDEVRGRGWGLAGFGLLLALSFVTPAVHSMVQASMMKSSVDAATRSWVFTGMNFLWAVLRAFSYVCFLVALLSRPKQPATPPAPYVPRPPY